MRVLIIKPDHMGDFALALPALWELRKRLGREAEIDVLTSAPNCEWSQILDWLPNIQAIRHPRYCRPPEPPFPLLRELFSQSLSLRKRRYDYAVELSTTVNDWVGKVMMILAGAKIRSGPEGTFDILLSEKYDPGTGHQTRILARRFPSEWKISGFTTPDQFMPTRYRNSGSAAKKILFSPWAGTDAKQWSLEQWRELALKLDGYEIEILSPPNTEERAKAIGEGIATKIIPTESISRTLEILSQARLVVTVDSAVAHFAWLTGTPVVELFSSTAQPSRWKSLAQGICLDKKPPCAPCHLEICAQVQHYCMLDISVEEVIESIHRLCVE